MFAPSPPAAATIRAIVRTAMDLSDWVDLGRLRALVMTADPLARARERLELMAPAPVVLFVVTPCPPTERDLIAFGAFSEAIRAAAADRGLVTSRQQWSESLDEMIRELGEIGNHESVAGAVALGHPARAS